MALPFNSFDLTGPFTAFRINGVINQSRGVIAVLSCAVLDRAADQYQLGLEMKLIAVVALLLATTSAAAAPAVRLVLSDCAPAPPPIAACPPVIPVYQLGQPVSFWVSAVDASGVRATNYSGTVVFSSSDGSATLPPPYAFAPSDNSVARVTIVFNSYGSTAGFLSGTNSQTVTATDAANGLVGADQFLLIGPPVHAVPTTGVGVLLLIAAGLGAMGCIHLRMGRASVEA